MFRLCGAGILPFRVKQDGTVAFLLGREAHSAGWAGSGKISAFEGGSNRQESEVDNAVREFVEESLGVLCDVTTPTTVANELQSGQYAVRVCVRNARRGEEHCTFVKRFDWTEDVLREFKMRRDALLRIQECERRLRTFESIVPKRYPFVRHGDALDIDGVAVHVVDMHAHLSEATLCMQVYLQDEPSGRRHVRRLSYKGRDHDLCVKYAQMVELRRELGRRIACIPLALHSALCVQRSRHGVVVDASVRSEWLEKMCVHEYTTPQLLSETLSNPSVFRPYFLVVLRHAIAQMMAPAPPHSVVSY